MKTHSTKPTGKKKAENVQTARTKRPASGVRTGVSRQTRTMYGGNIRHG